MTAGRSTKQVVGLSALGVCVFATVVAVGANIGSSKTHLMAPVTATASLPHATSPSPTAAPASPALVAASPTTSAFIIWYNTYARQTAGMMAADADQIPLDLPDPRSTDPLPNAVLLDCAALSGDLETVRSNLPPAPADDKLAGYWQGALAALTNAAADCDAARNGSALQTSSIANLARSGSAQLYMLDQKAHMFGMGQG